MKIVNIVIILFCKYLNCFDFIILLVWLNKYFLGDCFGEILLELLIIFEGLELFFFFVRMLMLLEFVLLKVYLLVWYELIINICLLFKDFEVFIMGLIWVEIGVLISFFV